MAGRGRIPNPALRRYDGVPAAPAVYVIEVGNGVLKVGRARSARARLRELHTAMVRKGRTPERFYIVPVADPIATETRCLRRMRALAASSHGEYFSGVEYPIACAVVAREASPEPAAPISAPTVASGVSSLRARPRPPA